MSYIPLHFLFFPAIPRLMCSPLLYSAFSFIFCIATPSLAILIDHCFTSVFQASDIVFEKASCDAYHTSVFVRFWMYAYRYFIDILFCHVFYAFTKFSFTLISVLFLWILSFQLHRPQSVGFESSRKMCVFPGSVYASEIRRRRERRRKRYRWENNSCEIMCIDLFLCFPRIHFSKCRRLTSSVKFKSWGWNWRTCNSFLQPVSLKAL